MMVKDLLFTGGKHYFFYRPAVAEFPIDLSLMRITMKDLGHSSFLALKCSAMFELNMSICLISTGLMSQSLLYFSNCVPHLDRFHLKILIINH